MLIKKAISQLLQVRFVLDQINSEEFNRKMPILRGSSIGGHVRHILEFYQCLLMDPASNEVNYDQRKRNMLLEENLKFATDFLVEIIDELEKVEANRRILLIAEYDNEITKMETSLYREIAYNIEHTIHHLAILAMAVKIEFVHITLPEELGYADSTLKFIRTQMVNA